MNNTSNKAAPESVKETPGQIIRRLRETHGYSQDKLSRLVFCTKQALYRLEKDLTKKPDLLLLKNLALQLNCTVDYILGDSPDPETNANGLKPLIIFESYGELINAYKDNQIFGELFIKCSQLLSKADRKALEQIMSSLLHASNTHDKSTNAEG